MAWLDSSGERREREAEASSLEKGLVDCRVSKGVHLPWSGTGAVRLVWSPWTAPAGLHFLSAYRLPSLNSLPRA